MTAPRHFLTLMDLAPDEIRALIARAIELKAQHRAGTAPRSLEGKVLAMIFTKASTRTRVSFEAGIAQLGGSALFLSGQDTQLGRGEPIEDTARVISSMVDIVMIRTFAHTDVEQFAAHSQVPVINGLTDDYHPCQILADLQTVEQATEKAKKAARGGDKEAKARLALLEKLAPVLAEGKPARGVIAGLTDPDEQKAAKSLGMISAKRVLYVANVDESDLLGQGPLASKVRERAAAEGMEVVPVCAKIESELAGLDDAERDEMLEAYGLQEPALATLARGAYTLLGLQSFYTAGEKEVRAWTVSQGATAPQAAGVIHSDFERGFIRAEIYSVADLAELKNEKAIREAGRLRVEGKAYVMQDGDVCHFLFNV